MDSSFDLGVHTRLIVTTSAKAQAWFDLGLNWLYGFNQEESVTCFLKALDEDPQCAMAHWGAAYASGPFYNMPWDLFSEHEEAEMLAFCHGHTQQALALKEHVKPVDRVIIEALEKRFQSDRPAGLDAYSRWDDDYADAMRHAHHQYPVDPDLAALFAEAMMSRTPWQLWDLKTGEVAEGADTLEAIEVLEASMAIFKELNQRAHPGLWHMYLHVLEMSPNPERAMLAADELYGVQPDAGHLNHMPAHIYSLCGRFEDALKVSETAIAGNRKYILYAGTRKFYTTAICHDLHMKMHAAMMCGRFQPAIDAANEIRTLLTDDLLGIDKPYMAMTLEGYYSMYVHVLVRFGRWQDIIDMPVPENELLYCVTIAMHHYARVIAYAALGYIAQAEQEKQDFLLALEHVPEDRYFFNNYSREALAIASAMLDGELEYHKDNHVQAYSHLRQAVERNDSLNYSEPWPWMHPPRHALGALLLAQGHLEEAEQVYRADLGLDDTIIRPAQFPGNVWSLHGYHECLVRRGAKGESRQVQAELEQAQARTDTGIHASCCCRE